MLAESSTPGPMPCPVPGSTHLFLLPQVHFLGGAIGAATGHDDGPGRPDLGICSLVICSQAEPPTTGSLKMTASRECIYPLPTHYFT